MNIEVLHKFITEFLNGEFSETSKALIKATADAATASANCSWFWIQVIPIVFVILMTILGSICYIGVKRNSDAMEGMPAVFMIVFAILLPLIMAANCSDYSTSIEIANNPLGHILSMKVK